MKTKVLLIVLFLLTLGILPATPPQWAWFQKTDGDGECSLYAMTSDSQNRIIVAGYFSGTVCCGAQTLISQGSRDAYVAQLDAGGNWLWARSLGGPGDDWAVELGVDAQDNIYMGGCFKNSMTIGNTTLTSLGDYDIYCVKYSVNGEAMDGMSLGSPQADIVQGLAVTPQGEVCLGGQFYHTISIGNTVLNTPNTNVFVAKLDNQLEPLWAQRAYFPDNRPYPELQNLGTDAAGNCYLIGNFDTQFSIGNPNAVSITSNNVSGFVVKLSPQGNGQWGERIGSGYAAVVDSYTDIGGNTYVTCDMVFLPMGDSLRLDNLPLCGKLNANGTWAWSINFADMDGCVINKIYGDESGNAYQTGILWTNYSFGNYALTGDVMTDNIYVAKANPAGAWQWGLQTLDAGMMFYMYVRDITALNNGDCVIAGVNSSEQLHFGDFLMPPAQSAYTFLVRVNGEGSANSDELMSPEPVEVSVYPNPASQAVHFEINSDKALSATANIYNIKGQLVKSYPGYYGKGSSFLWDGKDDKGKSCAAGIYFLKLTSGKETITKRFSRTD